jgi:hypothetical protein
MIVEMLDTHWPNKLARERVSADLNNPGLESDLYPVGSWRDHPPTGLVIDLSQPHPELAPPNSDDDDDDEPSSTQAAPHQYPAPIQPSDVNPRALFALMGLPACDGCVDGSNNWVIAGSHTASGKPMLSNDMHLSLMVPNIWFMADLRAPGLHAAGVTIPGFPFVIEGHNEHVAWGITALMGDADDLYIEKLDGKGNYQNADGTWRKRCNPQRRSHGPWTVAESDPAQREQADCAQVDPARSNSERLADLSTEHCAELDRFLFRACQLVLAHLEHGLRRRPGAHCLSRGGQGSPAAWRARRQTHQR